jgi:phage gpG-like protein
MPGFTISIRNEDVDRRLGLMSAKIQNKSEVLKIIGNVGVEESHTIFDESGSPAGSWKPSLRAAITGGKTLLDRGKLRASINYEIRGASQVAIGTNDIRAAIHQFGGIIRAKAGGYLRFKLAGGGATAMGAYQTVGGHRRKNYGSPWRMVKQVTMPARPFLAWTDRATENANRGITDYFMLDR